MEGDILMGYIWNNYKLERKFVIDDHPCPYTEVYDVNQNPVKVNILPRIIDILPFMYEYKEFAAKNKDFIDKIFNVAMHLVSLIDYQKNYDIDYVRCNSIRDDILRDKYGKDMSEIFKKCNSYQQHIVLYYLVKYHKRQQCTNYYTEVLKKVYDDVTLYYESGINVLHIHIDRYKYEYNEYHLRNDDLLKLINFFFCDMGLKKHVMWKDEMMGIIDVDYTMRIDEIVLY